MLAPDTLNPDPLELFLACAAAAPDHPAVVESGSVVSFGALEQQVRRLAAAIAMTGEHPRVLIALPAGADAYAAMFATLMAGGFYAPVNVAAPAAKRRLVAERFAPNVAIGAGPTDVPNINPTELPDAELATQKPAHELAYVIFTSGSTGVPKGVMIRRTGLAHYVAWARDAMAVGFEDRWSQHPNIGFDLSVLDIFGALCSGATLYPLSRNEARLMPGPMIRRNRLTIWNSVPSVLDIMRQGRQVTAENLASLRLMTFCGEPLLPEHLDALFAAKRDLLVHNTYGPTEATVSCTLQRLTASDYRTACGASVAVGEPISGMELRLVGGEGPDDGEIAILGPQLAAGYWNSLEETARAFRTLQTADGPRPAYFTGDRAERVGGHLFFRGRLDFQVKINGYRVELDEVGAALRDQGFAAACAGMVNGELHAFVEGNPGEIDVFRLRDALSAKLDPYAVPKHIHVLNHLPRNTNDKIDVAALAEQIASHESKN